MKKKVFEPEANIFDLCIIGGGINGTGIAADAAGRGLSVLLCEQGDLGSATSSASTKLIHGGLRYLEYYDFRLVHEALNEREILMNKAPHLIRPLNFAMPHNKRLRPLWLIRLGLFLYDHLGHKHRLPSSHLINLQKSPEGIPLNAKFKKGFTYSDCWVDDARLVIANAIAARDKGAKILPRTKCISVKRNVDHWEIHLLDTKTHIENTYIARTLVDAAGPWVNDVMQNVIHKTITRAVKLVKGSHIVLPKLYEGAHAYLLQNSDKRVVFAIPYENQFTLIGTTEMEFNGDPSTVCISEVEKDYLCDCINLYFKKSISPKEIIWSYSGVRPLQAEQDKDNSALSRDYQLTLDVDDDRAPLLTIYGGKITTYRKLSEHAVSIIAPLFGKCSHRWTENAPLPGGDIDTHNFETFFKVIAIKYPWVPNEMLTRLLHQYGKTIEKVLGNANDLHDLGNHFGHGLYAREVAYLLDSEWAETSEDILWRRTKLGLLFKQEEVKILEKWINENLKVQSEINY